MAEIPIIGKGRLPPSGPEQALAPSLHYPNRPKHEPVCGYGLLRMPVNHVLCRRQILGQLQDKELFDMDYARKGKVQKRRNDTSCFPFSYIPR